MSTKKRENIEEPTNPPLKWLRKMLKPELAPQAVEIQKEFTTPTDSPICSGTSFSGNFPRR